MKFCIVNDEDGHWYVIPVDKRDHWKAFLSDPENAYKNLPAYAKAINGHPNCVEFRSFTIRD